MPNNTQSVTAENLAAGDGADGWLDRAGRSALHDFVNGLRRSEAINQHTLRSLLTANANTEFGLNHHFTEALDSIRPVEAYKARVPLQTYSDVEPFIDRIARHEPNILTAEPVEFFAGTAGTTAQLKRIPRTKASRELSMRYIAMLSRGAIQRELPGGMAALQGRGINLMSGAGSTFSRPGEIPTFASTNSGIKHIRQHIPRLWTSPALVYELTDIPSALYLHALFGLYDPAVSYLSSIFATHLTVWFDLIERNLEQLLADISSGTISSRLSLDRTSQRKLAQSLKPDPNRAEFIAKAFEGGTQGIIPRLWAKCEYISTITTGSFSAALPRLRWLTGDRIPLYSNAYSSSEGIVGVQIEMDRADYLLANGAAHYEFIPEAGFDAAQPPTLQIKDLQVGEYYEVVISTNSGLYRYRLGDVIQVTEFREATPVFRFSYRRGTVLNMVGEKTTEEHVRTAVRRACMKHLSNSITPHAYAIAPSNNNGFNQYEFFFELDAESSVEDRQLQRLASTLERELYQANPCYLSICRQRGLLDPLRVTFVRPGALTGIGSCDSNDSRNTEFNQTKLPPLLWRPQMLDHARSRAWHSTMATVT